MSAPRPRQFSWRWPVAALCAVALAASVSPSAQAKAPADVVTPLPTQQADFRLRGATGDVLWVQHPETASDDIPMGQRISTDGGATWHDGPVWDEVVQSAAGGGHLALFGGTDGEHTPWTIDAATGQLNGIQWEEEWTLAAIGPSVALATNGRLASTTKTVKVTFPKLPSSAKKPSHSYGFTSDSAYVVRISHPKSGSDYAGVVATATGKATGRLTLPRAAAHRVGGSAVYSLVAAKAGLSVCRQPLPSGTSSCTVVATGDHRKAKVTLYQAGAISLVKDSKSATPLMLDGSTVTPVTLPAGTVSWKLDGPGDPTRPLVRVVGADGEATHLRVAADGSTSEYLAVPRLPRQLRSLGLTPDTLLGSYYTPESVWLRSPAEDTDLEQWKAAAVLGASAGRYVLENSDRKVSLWGSGGRERSLSFTPRDLSGPYGLTWSDRVYTVDGKRQTTSRPEAVFGSLVAEQVVKKGTVGHVLRIRDLADSSFAPVTVQLTEKTTLMSFDRFWGDWVGTTIYTDDAKQVVLHNWVTGATLTHPGTLDHLGDGVALVEVPTGVVDFTLVAWDFLADHDTELGDGIYRWESALDGNRVAFATDTDLVLRTLAGVGTSAPRLLGALTKGKATKASPWQLELDLTKALQAGSLVIKAKDGTVVRTLAAAAATSGSLRGLAWNGRDEAGVRVKKGTYTWELVAEASDGSGPAVAVTGTRPPTGKVKVS